MEILMMSEDEIKKLCRKYGIKNYQINDDMSVDVDGDVNLCYLDLESIPINFGKITGDFGCAQSKLTSLKGCPHYVGGSFSCDWNQLTSLEYCPKHVSGNFYCRYNKLSTLKGCPEYVGGSFFCKSNVLTSLKFSPKILNGGFYFNYNPILTRIPMNKLINHTENIPSKPHGFYFKF